MHIYKTKPTARKLKILFKHNKEKRTATLNNKNQTKKENENNTERKQQ